MKKKKAAYGCIAVIGHHHQEEAFCGGTGTKKIALGHALKERHHLTVVWGSILGVTEDEEQASTKAKLPRNEYMGVWRWGSFQMRKISPRLPTMVVR